MVAGLALWMAMPAFQWCSVDWEKCRAAIVMTCEAAAHSDAEPMCEATGCPLARDCDGRPSPGPARVWCVGAPADGVAPREIFSPLPDAPAVTAPITDPAPPAPRSTRERVVERPGLCPAILAAHAPPLTRAPPLG
jgi:hypothetical protein